MTVYLYVVVVVIIASIIILWRAEKSVDLKLQEMERVQLSSQAVNVQLRNELQYWQYRRKLLERFPVSLRKKKIRGKKRKGKK
jgi:hypothetical protein